MKSIVLGLAVLCLAPLSFADISNATIRDYTSAIESRKVSEIIDKSRALASEAMQNADDDQASLLAFEAAWTLCSLERCADAVDAADFVARQTVSDAAAHPVRQDRNLLLAYARWRNKATSQTRKALDDALGDMDDVEPSLLSVKAFTERYRVDQAGTDRDQTKRTAQAAREHLEQLADLVPDQLAVANFVEAASAWGGGIRSNDQIRMEHAKWQFQILLADDKFNNAAGLEDLRWKAEAWGSAMRAFVIARARGAGPNKRTAGKFPGMTPDEAREVAQLYAPKLAALKTPPEQPRCIGALSEQPDRVPRGRDQTRGYVGTVIVGIDVEAGELKNIRVLAAVPDDKYSQFALDAFKGIRWEKAETQPVADCNDSFEELVVPFSFSF